MEILIFVIFIICIMAAIGNSNQNKITEAKTAYDDSLAKLRHNPTNANLRQKTLELGRSYSNLTRKKKGVALFDEVALMNDLNAVAGGTMAMANPSLNPVGTAQRPVGERLRELSKLQAQKLISDAEYEQRKSSILSEV